MPQLSQTNIFFEKFKNVSNEKLRFLASRSKNERQGTALHLVILCPWLSHPETASGGDLVPKSRPSLLTPHGL